MGSNRFPTLLRGPLSRWDYITHEDNRALWADHSKISIGLRISFDLPEPSILDIGEYGAAVAAPIAEGRDHASPVRSALAWTQFLKSRRAFPENCCQSCPGCLQKSSSGNLETEGSVRINDGLIHMFISTKHLSEELNAKMRKNFLMPNRIPSFIGFGLKIIPAPLSVCEKTGTDREMGIMTYLSTG